MEDLGVYRPEILIVDDKPANLVALEKLLGELPVDVIRADSGNQALALTLEHDFALALMDVQMPDMDGFETVELLRMQDKTRYLPVIFVSAVYSGDFYKIKGVESGAIDFIEKPIVPELLVGKVRQLLKIHRYEIALKRSNAELEEKVRERTRLLEEANAKLEELNETLAQRATTDGLTQIANRRCFDETIANEWKRLVRVQRPVSLILADIDFFKKYNDHYGHQAGDDSLRHVAEKLVDSVKRPSDLVARYGGEEFALLLPEVETEGVCLVGNRALAAILDLDIEHVCSEISDRLTISLGGATMVPSQNNAPSDLIALADKALYRVKAEGRNRLIVAEFEP